MKFAYLFCFASLSFLSASFAQHTGSPSKSIKVFVIGSMDKYHSPMVKKSMPLFQKLAADHNFEIHFTRDTAELTPQILSKYQVFVQLSLSYFDLSHSQQFAIQQFINSGRGWIGIHAAGLTGNQFVTNDGHDWKWYWHLLGDAYYTPHPPLQNGVVNVVNQEHPVTKNLPSRFSLRDEWYEFQHAPTNVNVLAVADESTYQPKKPMGYHPVIWTNPAYNRALYISVGHDTTSCDNESYQILLRDAIQWAAGDDGQEKKVMDASQQSKGFVLVNQVGYDSDHPKTAIFKSKFPLGADTRFRMINAMTLDSVYGGKLGKATQIVKQGNEEWSAPLDFSSQSNPGYYNLEVLTKNNIYESVDFQIGQQLRKDNIIPPIHSDKALPVPPKFKAIVLTERGGHHESFVVAGLEWLRQYSKQENFEYIVLNKPDTITKEFLKAYQLFIQLDFPPYMWSDQSKAAFEDYIDQGQGAWIGFHHASLLGEFDGYPMWPWFSDFLGGIRFKNYIAARADGEVYLEKKRHPVFTGLPSHFKLPGEEWYTFDKNPREKVEVLATVDENSYQPATDIKMGDHPVIWSNPKKKAKNIYFLFGHHGGLFEVSEFTQLLTNTMKWAVRDTK